jgi:1-phosphofructokinase family hexose kinase
MIYTITLNPSIDRTLHYPQLVLGTVNRASWTRTDLSGKGVNVSVALRQLGIPSVLMGFCAGVSGRVLVEGLEAQGFVCDFVEISDGETRSNITVIDRASGMTTKLNEAGPQVSEEDLEALAERLRQRLTQGDICVYSGSLPPGAPPDTYAQLVRIARQAGAITALDSSGVALQRGCAARPDWLKPNDVEAAELVGRSISSLESRQALEEMIRTILSLGPQRVLLTLGRRGAIYADGHNLEASKPDLWWARPPAIAERGNVGAGDAALAGALSAWQKGCPPEEVARWAVAVGTAAAQEEGTGMPSLERIEAAYQQVGVIHLGAEDA